MHTVVKCFTFSDDLQGYLDLDMKAKVTVNLQHKHYMECTLVASMCPCSFQNNMSSLIVPLTDLSTSNIKLCLYICRILANDGCQAVNEAKINLLPTLT